MTLSDQSDSRWRRRARRLRLVDDYGVSLLGMFLVIFIGAAVFIGVVLAVDWKIESRNCAFAASRFHSRTHYDVLAGCYIDAGDGRMIPLDKYRAFGRFR